MKKWIALVFFAAAGFATVNEPLRWELFSGYRNDRVHWHLQDPGEGGLLIYRELYRDVQLWENGLTFKAIHRDLSFFVRGAYGAFGRGRLFQRYADLNFTSDQPQFQFDTTGWTADGSGYFGYAVNLTADRVYKVILTPLLGYSGHFEQLKRNSVSPDPLQAAPAFGADYFQMQSQLPGTMRLSWNGVFIGGGFTIEPASPLVLNVGYTYHWLRTRLHTHVQNTVSLFTTAPTPVSEQTTQFSLKATGGGNLGHTGWAQFDYAISQFWRAGIGGQIHYFSSQIIGTSLKQTVQSLLPLAAPVESSIPQKYKIRWTSVSGWAQVSGEF